MGNSIFDALNSANQQNSLFGIFGGFQRFQKQFNDFAANFTQQANMSPEQKVRELLNSGQMTQEQFNAIRDIANRITGKHF